jgi:wobble nucleotide-excising tRNase
MTMALTPSMIGLLITILGTIIGFIVQHNIHKFKIEQNEKAIKSIRAQWDTFLSQGSPKDQETEKEIAGIIKRLDRLEENARNYEKIVERIDERILALDKKLDELKLIMQR